MTDLAGASIIVLGATGGLGREFARQLAASGARLTLTGRSMLALDDLDIDGAALIPADLTDVGEAEKVIAAAKSAHGRVDGVIVASGAVAFGSIIETSDETLEALWAINVLAPMRVLRAAAGALAHSAAAGGSPFVVSI
ncbi:MAG: SDR family NAD(P)-dependent oxidoreductase, partial [Microbacteriaceae bacterium]|nr:SDR family NAD(P)-dependent oxidoreductase [Microbacteriaceae bacterium]